MLMQVRGSLAKRALSEMEGKGLIKLVSSHSSQLIYTRMVKDIEDEPEGGVVVEKKAVGGKKGKKAKAEEAGAEE